jgi:hypothetical protein
MTRKLSSWTPPPSKKPPADLIREAVAEATAFGARQGFGRVVSDKYVEGIGVVLTFEGGQQTHVPMPAGSTAIDLL